MFQQTSGVVAADGGQSVALGNGQSLWLFGDSYIDNYDAQTQTVPCLFQVRNAAAVVDNDTVSVTKTLLGENQPASYFHLEDEAPAWFWPNQGYSTADRVYVFQSLIRQTGEPGAFGFESVDHLYISQADQADLSDVTYLDLGPKNEIHFGVGAFAHDGMTYTYGIRDNGFGRDLFVARFRGDDPRNTWEYRTTWSWSNEIDDAVAIHSEFTGSFHVMKVHETFVLITTEFSVGCDQGSEIYSATSPSPEGPFGDRQVIWKVDDTVDGHLPFFYAAHGHPEYDDGNDALLVTYAINGYGDCVESCVDGRLDPNFYRLRAIRVPYALIGIAP